MGTGRLIYEMNVSLDGYVAEVDGGLDWTRIDDELHGWFNDHARTLGGSLYGRRLWELMSGYWPTAGDDPEPTVREFARIWASTPIAVVSSRPATLPAPALFVEADPIAAFERLRAAVDGDIDVGGATLAAAFIERDLVDEYRLVVHPVVLGAGVPYFPGGVRPGGLELTDQRRFASGAVLLAYRRDREKAPA